MGSRAPSCVTSPDKVCRRFSASCAQEPRVRLPATRHQAPRAAVRRVLVNPQQRVGILCILASWLTRFVRSARVAGTTSTGHQVHRRVRAPRLRRGARPLVRRPSHRSLARHGRSSAPRRDRTWLAWRALNIAIAAPHGCTAVPCPRQETSFKRKDVTFECAASAMIPDAPI